MQPNEARAARLCYLRATLKNASRGLKTSSITFFVLTLSICTLGLFSLDREDEHRMASTGLEQEVAHHDAAHLAGWRLSLLKRRQSAEFAVERNFKKKLSSLSQVFRGTQFNDSSRADCVNGHNHEDAREL